MESKYKIGDKLKEKYSKRFILIIKSDKYYTFFYDYIFVTNNYYDDLLNYEDEFNYERSGEYIRLYEGMSEKYLEENYDKIDKFPWEK